MSGEVEHAPLSGSSRAPVIGRLLAGRYRLQGILGEGGMAVVYEGEHVAIGKRVAIKIVQSLFANDDEIVSRFEREARSASAVESEHIVHVFDVGADPELGLFLVMELLKGEDLGHVLARRTRLDPIFACGIGMQAALGLEKAHAAGIAHRDLKPANVFLVERDDGTTLVKLVDFGIAKVMREAHDARFSRNRGITRAGTAIGTPQYMSPEQAQGLETVDHRTDVYSLGAVLFEAMAGQPYMAERATYEQTILQLISTPAPRLSTVVPAIPQALDDLIAAMLEHDLDRRVPDMRTVRDRLSAIYPELHGSSVRLRSLPPPSSGSLDRYVVHASASPHNPTVPGTAAVIPLVHRRRRSTTLIAWVAGAAAILGIGLGLSALRRPSPPSTPAAPASAAVSPVALTPSTAPVAIASPPASASASASATDPGVASTAFAPPRLPTASPMPPATKKAPAANPSGKANSTGQVGAAGISSEF
jgi:eukaryotic-like serine/threonine-protein kinase